MIVVDSCGWLEHITAGPAADEYEPYLESPDLIVPTVVLHEVYKVLRRDSGEEVALQAVARLKAAILIPLDDRLALEAADLSLRHRLPLADAVVYATAQAYGALLVTGDAHFRDVPGVQYVAPGEKGENNS